MKAKQRECLQFGSCVMEGRDIGSNIFPETDYKFFLDASPEVRKFRRERDGVKEDVHARDKRDSQRPWVAECGPFQRTSPIPTGDAKILRRRILAPTRFSVRDHVLPLLAQSCNAKLRVPLEMIYNTHVHS